MIATLKNLVKHEAFGGGLLVVSAAIALILANSGAVNAYQQFLSIPVNVSFGDAGINKSLLLWINDGLMAIFFFLVGLEIKREVMEGQLSSPSQLILPGVAAICGIAIPALAYAFFNMNDPIAFKGWAVPSATDIAFALGVFALFGKGLPLALKLFLLTVAIFDDIGAIAIIAIFYTSEISMSALGVAAISLVGLFFLNRFSVAVRWAYGLITLVLWVAVLKSGVHATLAGFAAALFIPLKSVDGKSMLHDLEHSLHGLVMFIVLPIFAFSNAGVSMIGLSVDDLLNPISIGIVAGLFLGKQVAILGSVWLVVKFGWAKLPAGVTWLQIYGVSLLCGIGFTMSLFIGTLAFSGLDPSYLQSVKIGVLAGSFLSAIVGSIVIAYASKQFRAASTNTQTFSQATA